MPRQYSTCCDSFIARPLPFANHNHLPPNELTTIQYHTFLQDSRHVTTIIRNLNSDLPLDSSHRAALQNLRLINLLNHLDHHPQPDVELLGLDDLIHNVEGVGRHLSPPSTASSSSSSSSNASISLPVPPPRRSRRARTQTIMSVPLTHATRTSMAPGAGDSPNTLIDVDSTEEAFELPLDTIVFLANNAERENIYLTQMTIPLLPTHPNYHRACFECRRQGHIHINCQCYECPLCHKSAPGHTQRVCPWKATWDPDTWEDDVLHGDDVFDDSALANMTGLAGAGYRDL